jgi:hypothetical protein
MLLLPGRQTGEGREPSKKQCSFGNPGASDSQVLSHFSSVNGKVSYLTSLLIIKVM